MIKALIFDFVQTLGDAASGYKDGEKNSQNKLIEKFGITDTEKFLEDYRAVRKKHFLAADFSRKNQWLELQEKYGVDAGEDFLNNLENEYWDINFWFNTLVVSAGYEFDNDTEFIDEIAAHTIELDYQDGIKSRIIQSIPLLSDIWDGKYGGIK